MERFKIENYRLAVVSDSRHADYGSSVRLLSVNPDGMYIAWAYGSGKYLLLSEDQVQVQKLDECVNK